HPVAAALREMLARYGFAAAPLLELIEARTFDLYDEPMASVADLELYGIRTQSPVFAMASGILGTGQALPDMFTLDAGIAAAIGAILSRLGLHASRKQLYLPMDLLERHGVNSADIYAGRAGAPLHAALAELRALARQHLAAAQDKLAAAPPEILPAFLPVALVGPLLRRMERAGYDSFTFEPSTLLSRQWTLWRAARDPSRIFRT
ncbi:MAG: squalene/phytoene synthase family protein, partial [Rhizobiales bacterium]|nr:squalene/phytoene synthase family protein [Hyphomicrobiales bacterium]